MQNNQTTTLNIMQNSIDNDEIAKFSRMADAWWDPYGAFKPLHDITPLRIQYIKEHCCRHFDRNPEKINALEELTLLDIGCGGGLAAEPLSRLGAAVTAIDASEKNIAVAAQHAASAGLQIQYMATSAERLVEDNHRYDIVIALEIIEHVADVEFFLRSLSTLTKPGGLLFITTLNRTIQSLLMAKIGAEYLLRWLPVGTHDWNKFLRPSEIILPLEKMGFDLYDLHGMRYRPLLREWVLEQHAIEVNYLLCFHKIQQKKD